MAFLTALGNAAGGYSEGARQKALTDDEKQRLRQEQEATRISQQTSAQQLAYDQQRLANEQTNQRISLNQAGYDAAGNPIPTTAKYLPIPDDASYEDIAKISAHNLAVATAAGDQRGITNWGKAASSIPRGYQETTTGAYNAGPRTDLAKAQTTWWQGRHQEFEDALNEKLKAVDAQTAARMQAARISASRRAAASGVTGLDAREIIGIGAALSAASNKDDQQNFQAGMAAYHTAATAWQNQERSYTAGFGNDPGPAPQPQQFIINTAPAAAPSVTLVTIPLPGGGTTQVPVVTRNGQPGATPGGGAAAGGGKDLAHAAPLVAGARAHGHSDADIKAAMKQDGYSPQVILQALSGSVGGTAH